MVSKEPVQSASGAVHTKHGSIWVWRLQRGANCEKSLPLLGVTAKRFQIYMLQYLTPDVTLALLKVQQGTEVHIAGESFK